MRLAEDRIKDGLLHPEKLVRQEALYYFERGHTRDQDVMPRAVQAVETYGRDQAFFYGNLLADLPQTEDTITWAIRRLSGDDALAWDRTLHLSRLLTQADPRLLAPREQDVLGAPGFNPDRAPDLRDWLTVSSWDAGRCWKELNDIAEAAKSSESVGAIGWDHLRRVIETLARQEDPDAGRVLDLLDQKIEDYVDNPMVWLETFAVMLAGELRLEAAVPRLVAELHEEDEVLAEECVTALGKIGTDGAAVALGEGFLEASWDYRLFASGTFDLIHADATVRTCLDLLPREKKADIRSNLAAGVVANFAFEGVEPVRDLILKRRYEPQMVNLPGKLAAACTLMGVTFPELEIWKRQALEGHARIQRNIQAMEDELLALPPAPPPRETAAREAPRPVVRQEQKVGRNDPCPCGSGKKFKKCCMGRPG